MEINQHKWMNASWQDVSKKELKPQLSLLFGSRLTIEKEGLQAIEKLNNMYPESEVITVSTAGNILDDSLLDDTIIATCIQFKKTNIKTKSFLLGEESDEELGKKVAGHFDSENLAYLMIFSTSGVNAGNVLKGINSVFKGRVPVSGGVAGDDTRFEKTLVGIGKEIKNGQIIGIAFYGNDLVVSHGSKGGWDKFGPIRKVTRSLGNILYELDNKPVLDLYKTYLGEKAKELPASGLLFPLAIIENSTKEPIVRGIQNINEKENSLILYGDIYEGQSVQLMRANFDGLIKGAAHSANEAFNNLENIPQLAILISCIARRIALGAMTEEELVETKGVFSPETKICGFYSYSELSPVVGDNSCHLHNQTMTITTLSEK